MQKMLNWIDERFPLSALWKSQVSEYYAPKNFNFWYFFGSLALVVLVMQIVTGIFLTMSYKPDATKAFESVEYIMRDVSGGWFIRYLHSTGASAFFIVVYLHMFRALLYGSYRKPRELLWIVGCFIYLALMAEAFFGYLLPWGQMSYWGAQVIVNLFSAVPLIGDDLGIWIRGDYTISDVTLEPLFRFPRHRGAAGAAAAGRRAPDGAARGRVEQSGRRRDPGQEGPADRAPARRHPVPSVLHGQGPGRRRRVPRAVLGRRVLLARRRRLLPRGQQLHSGQSAADARAHRAGLVFHAVLRDAARGPVVPAVAVLGRAGDGRRGRHPVLHAVARSRPGEVDPLSRAPVQDLARDFRRLLSGPRLSRHRPGHRLGPVRRHDGRGRPRHRRRARPDRWSTSCSSC